MEIDLSSLVGQTFTEEECLVTINSFPWHGGLQKRGIIMAKVTRKNTIRVSSQLFYSIGKATAIKLYVSGHRPHQF